MKNRQQFLAHSCRGARVGITAVEENCLLQAIEVRGAIRTVLQVIPDCGSASPRDPAVELLCKLPRNRSARAHMSVKFCHDRKPKGFDHGPFFGCPPQPQNNPAVK